MRKPGWLVLLAASALSGVWAQDIISVRSGLIHHIEGAVNLDGEPVEIGNARFPVMANSQVLEVENGYAEVLLTPGAFLRLDAGASVRLAANALEDTRLELLSGTALVEVDELLKANHISVTVGEFQTDLLKNGLYYFDAEAGRLKVFDGKVRTTDGGLPVELGKGRTIQFDSEAFDAKTKPEKFDRKQSKDALYAWSERRAARLGAANLSASRGWSGPRVRSSIWAWDPWMNMYTFMPGSGTAGSVFGPRWYNPQSVWVVSQPQSFGTGVSMSGPSQGPASSSGGGNGGGASVPASSGSGPSGGGAVGSTTPSGAPVTHTVGRHAQ